MSSDKPKTVKPKVVRVLKEKKVSVEVPRSEPIDIPIVKPEPKKRPSRAKKPPTRDEALQLLLEASNGLKKLIVDLKDDETKLKSSGFVLTHVSELIEGELENLAEELKDVDQNYQEVLEIPAEQPAN